MLRRYRSDPMHVLQEIPVSITQDMTYIEEPKAILDTEERVLRNKKIPLVKVQWSKHSPQEATWEREEDMRVQFPKLFESSK